jgi:hypothetical protein
MTQCYNYSTARNIPKIDWRQRPKHAHNEEPTLDFEICKHNSPPCKAFSQLWQFEKSFILPNRQVIDTFTYAGPKWYLLSLRFTAKMLIISHLHDVTNFYNNLGCKLNYFYTI